MKRIAIFCDGTWNSADQARNGVPCPTNVVKLALRLAPSGNGATQVTYYDQGVGTGNWLDRLSGGAFGNGLTDNLFEAYRFLMQNYEPGDELYFFGFSRGAFTARSIVGMIRKCGILKRHAAARYHDVVELYQGPWHPEDEKAREFRKAHCVVGDDPIPVEMIGVWDTVGALGIPLRGLRSLTAKKHEFHDVRLSGTVKRAYQALAIDERRGPFEAARWADVPKSGQIVEQVWFAGVHSDVGGGYAPGENPADGWGLSDIALEWMCDKAMAAGLHLDAPAFPMRPDPLATEHNSMSAVYWVGRRRRAIGLAASDKTQPDGKSGELDRTQSVHSSVLTRWDARKDYRPPNLREYFVRVGDARGASG